jgi:hypothetical protein
MPKIEPRYLVVTTDMHTVLGVFADKDEAALACDNTPAHCEVIEIFGRVVGEP